MPKKQDALEYLNELDGWSVIDMQRTVGKMMRGVERIMDRITLVATGILVIPDDRNGQADARYMKDLASALKAIADSMERYTGIYAWCQQHGTTGNSTTALEDVLPLLNTEETHMMHQWMRRLEAYKS